MKTFKLSVVFLAYLFSALSLMTLFGVFLTYSAFALHQGPPPFVAVISLLIMAFIWLQYLRIPYQIDLLPDESIVFQSFIARKVLSPMDIKSIKSGALSPGYIMIKHVSGRISLISQIDGLHEFITIVRSLNPGVEVRGI